MNAWKALSIAALLWPSAVLGQENSAEKARAALSYIDCDGDSLTIRNGRIGILLGGRFVADTILGATYVGNVYVWGGDDKRYKLIFSSDLSKVTLLATNGHGSIEGKCHRMAD
ncbi:MAG: hypothetical protein JSR61_02605 [Proteobacteria bacterium]|nr:hypothetical protein [Pseudomonadota bacterium]